MNQTPTDNTPTPTPSPTDAAEPTTEAATEAPPETTEPLQTMGEKSATHHGDKYDQEIERLIKQAEQVRAQEEETPGQTEERQSKGLLEGESWDKVFDSQTPEAQRAMSSLRADYTKKTQELAAMRKELASQKEALLQSDVMKQLKATAEGEIEDFDPFDPESFKKYVEKEVSLRLAAVLQPMQEEQQKMQAQQKVSAFVEAHPELKTNGEFKNEVKNLLLANESLDLESAYWIAKGKASAAQQAVSAEETKKRQEAAMRTASMISAGARRNAASISPNLKELKAWEIYQHLKGSKVR